MKKISIIFVCVATLSSLSYCKNISDHESNTKKDEEYKYTATMLKGAAGYCPEKKINIPTTNKTFRHNTRSSAQFMIKEACEADIYSVPGFRKCSNLTEIIKACNKLSNIKVTKNF